MTPLQVILEKKEIELYSSAPHFKIEIAGVFFGPELNAIKNFFKGDVKVYVLVEEYSKQDKKDLLWVQKNEFGVLNGTGHYTARAYLGGCQEVDKAKDNDIFCIYTYIPLIHVNKKTSFDEYAVYNKENLPTALYKSDPIYIKTKRTL